MRRVECAESALASMETAILDCDSAAEFLKLTADPPEWRETEKEADDAPRRGYRMPDWKSFFDSRGIPYDPITIEPIYDGWFPPKADEMESGSSASPPREDSISLPLIDSPNEEERPSLPPVLNNSVDNVNESALISHAPAIQLEDPNSPSVENVNYCFFHNIMTFDESDVK